MASAIVLPMLSSELAEMVPTCAIALLSLHGLLSFLSSSIAAVTALSMPRLMSIGLRPEATALRPSRMIACARTVAVGAVAGFIRCVGGDFLHHLRAHVLELVLELNL